MNAGPGSAGCCNAATPAMIHAMLKRASPAFLARARYLLGATRALALGATKIKTIKTT